MRRWVLFLLLALLEGTIVLSQVENGADLEDVVPEGAESMGDNMGDAASNSMQLVTDTALHETSPHKFYSSTSYNRSVTLVGKIFEKLNSTCIPITEENLRHVFFSRDLERHRDCKFVVVCALFGDLDLLDRPPPDPQTCYMAFLDMTALRLNAAVNNASRLSELERIIGWNITIVKYDTFPSAREATRVLKLDLPRVFPWARWSLWIDAKHALKIPLPRIVDRILGMAPDVKMAFLHHHERISVFEELAEVAKRGMVPGDQAARQRSAYIESGMDPNRPSGLVDGAFILRDHKALPVHFLSCMWAEQYKMFPPRDQTSFNYVLHNMGYKTNTKGDELIRLRIRLKNLWQKSLVYDGTMFQNSKVLVLARKHFWVLTKPKIHLNLYERHGMGEMLNQIRIAYATWRQKNIADDELLM